MVNPNAEALDRHLSAEQEKLLKLADLDAANLIERAGALPESSYKSQFLASLDLAMTWFRKAVAQPFTPNP